MASSLEIQKLNERGPAKDEKLSPIDVLQENMEFWHKASVSLTHSLAHMYQTTRTKPTAEQLDELVKYRNLAVRAATILAPYYLGKQAPVGIGNENNELVIKIEGGLQGGTKEKG